MSRQILIGVALLASVQFARRCSADDWAIVKASSGNGQSRISGRIADFSGQGLVIERLGRQERIAAERVVELHSDWSAKHSEGDQHRAAGRFREALVAYGDALREEPRVWVQRRLLSGMAICYANLGEFATAGEAFLRVTANDPESPYWLAIPLNWQTVQPDAATTSQARTWLQDAKSPIARLIGASWLLSTNDRAAAVRALEQLSSSDDASAARLAEAQLWRIRLVQATESDVHLWTERIDQIPRELQAGPYFLIGQAYARLNQSEQAALALMRVPVLFPDQADLAAASLTLAARQLENLQQPTDAARLYREVLARHADSRQAQEAQLRLKSLNQASP